MGLWVDGWIDRYRLCQITKNQINLDLIEIIQFCLKNYDLLRHAHLWVGVWVIGWMDRLMDRSCQITSSQINVDHINIAILLALHKAIWLPC